MKINYLYTDKNNLQKFQNKNVCTIKNFYTFAFPFEKESSFEREIADVAQLARAADL